LGRIGALALQGDFELHIKMLRRAGVEAAEIRTPAQLDSVSGLVIPGGESTTVSRLMRRYGLDKAIRDRYLSGSLAVYGTCMGMILVCSDTEGDHDLAQLGFIDATVERNAYGPQVESFESDIVIDSVNGAGPMLFRAVFIRAPKVTRLGDGVKILASHAGAPALISQGLCLAGNFHPELTDDWRLHKYFLDEFAARIGD